MAKSGRKPTHDRIAAPPQPDISEETFAELCAIARLVDDDQRMQLRHRVQQAVQLMWQQSRIGQPDSSVNLLTHARALAKARLANARLDAAIAEFEPAKQQLAAALAEFESSKLELENANTQAEEQWAAVFGAPASQQSELSRSVGRAAGSATDVSLS